MQTVLLHIFNKTYLEAENLLIFFVAAAYFEIIFSIFALFLVIISLYIATTIPQFNKNLLYLIYIFGLQYFISTFAKAGINFIQFYGDIYRFNESSLFLLVLFRSFCIFLATYSMPAMVAERVFATILIKDYEFNPRRWIFIFIATFEFFMSFCSVYLFYYENLPEIYFLTFILFLDVTAFIIYMICEYINLRRYQRYFRTNLNCFTSKKSGMSLSERFQLAENIKSSRVFKPLAVLVTIFNVLLVAIGLAKPLNLGIFAKNIIYLLFELNIVIYAVCVPSITLLRNQIWRHQIYEIFSKIPVIRNCLPKMETNTVHLRNTFGKNMILNVDRQQNYYFKELNKSWNLQPNRNSQQ